MKEQKDPLTGETFKPTRITQKFANAQNRVRYHNLKANELRHKSLFVNTPLRKNLRILTELMNDKSERTFHKQFLLGRGFTFGVMTHYVNLEKQNYPCVYQFLLKPSIGEQVIIIKQK